MDTSSGAVKARIHEAFGALSPPKTKARIARETGVEPQNVNNWLKTGKVSRERAYALATALECSTDWLLAGEGAMARSSGSLDKNRLVAALDLLFSATRNTDHDVRDLSAVRCANIVAIVYDLLSTDAGGKPSTLHVVKAMLEHERG